MSSNVYHTGEISIQGKNHIQVQHIHQQNHQQIHQQYNSFENDGFVKQNEFYRVLGCMCSPLFCLPLFCWNDCCRPLFNKYYENYIPPVGVIQDLSQNNNNKHIETCDCCYPQQESYSTTKCCVHYHFYDPCY